MVEHPSVPPEAVTQILNDTRDGRTGAAERLFQLVHDELRRLAASYIRGERPGHTLQATALVHEACPRRPDGLEKPCPFFRGSAGDAAYPSRPCPRAGAIRRRGGRRKVSLEDTPDLTTDRSDKIVAVDAALSRLFDANPRKSRLVESRFFGGLDIEETAKVPGVSLRTVKRDRTFAKAWLYRETGGG